MTVCDSFLNPITFHAPAYNADLKKVILLGKSEKSGLSSAKFSLHTL